MCLLSFTLSVTGTYCLRFLAEKTVGAEHTGCWTPFVNTCADDVSTTITWAASCNKLLKIIIKKEQKLVSLKRFLKAEEYCWIMWQCYMECIHCVHGTLCCFFLLCQPVHLCIEPFLHGLDFSVPPIPALVLVSEVIPLILTGISITKIKPNFIHRFIMTNWLHVFV